MLPVCPSQCSEAITWGEVSPDWPDCCHQQQPWSHAYAVIGSNTINNNNNIVLEIQDELEECDILSYPPPIFSVSQAPGKLQTMPDLPLNIAAIGSETESFIAALENWQAQNVHKSKKGMGQYNHKKSLLFPDASKSFPTFEEAWKQIRLHF